VARVPDTMTRTRSLPCLLPAALTLAMAAPGAGAPLAAQEVVQAIPPREAGELSAAMRRLAQRPTDLEALLRAGNASLALRDPGAAAGFFARAAAVAPGDARVLLGQARVALEQRRPVEALELFARAEQAGARAQDMATDRGLAFDLVGDNAAAQALYRGVLAVRDDAEVRRRLALSLAIAGNRQEFERTLYPLLRTEDRQAFRTRAFGLAILGLTDDAVGIADAMMPTDLALRMAPYLRYMPRLTKAQQAAAGNLGAFPAAAEIGRDSADIAGYASAGARIAARADAALTPSGAALGPRQPDPAPGSSAVRRRPAGASAGAAPAVRVAQAEVPNRPAQAPAPAPAPSAAVVVATAPPPSLPPPQSEPERPSLSEAFADLGAAPVVSTAPAAGAVDVAKLAAARATEEAKARKDAEAKAKARREAEAREARAKAEKAAREAEPARFWLQVGVGRNLEAFAFDWRRLERQADGALAGKGPWAARYGATNRMLAGPYASEAAARAAIKLLKDKGIDALPYKSAQGENVAKPG
jgi:hypothetical protein